MSPEEQEEFRLQIQEMATLSKKNVEKKLMSLKRKTEKKIKRNEKKAKSDAEAKLKLKEINRDAKRKSKKIKRDAKLKLKKMKDDAFVHFLFVGPLQIQKGEIPENSARCEDRHGQIPHQGTKAFEDYNI